MQSSTAPAQSPALRAALVYARLGWHVLPTHYPTSKGCSCGKHDCPHPAKHPACAHGLTDATVDERTIRGWFGNGHAWGVGVACRASGLVVLDVDQHGVDGEVTLRELEAKHGPLPRTCEARTGGGGRHLFFLLPPGKLRGQLGPGVDVRAEAYVLVEPSRHSSGGAYYWERAPESCPPVELPEAWLSVVRKPEAEPQPLSPAKKCTSSDGTAYGLKLLEGVCSEVAGTPEGGRNAVLNSCALRVGHYVAGGDLAEEHARRRLLDAAAACGLPEGEALDVIDRALRDGAREPRSAPERPSSAPEEPPPPADEDAPPDVADDEHQDGERPREEKRCAESLDVVDLLTVEPTPPRWLIGGLVQEDQCAVIGGEPKAGKTWFALDMALCLASGRRVLDRWEPCRAGKVLLFSPEGGPLVASNRAHQLCWGMGINPADISGRLLGLTGRLHVDCEQDYQRLLATIGRERPDVLLLDPLIGVHHAAENESSEMQPVLDGIRDLRQAHPGLCIWLVHHTSKGGRDQSRGYALRGSSALGGWYDTLISVRLPGAEGDWTRRVDVDHRCASPPDPVGFTLQAGPGLVAGLEAIRLTACDAPAIGSPPGRGGKQRAEASGRKQQLVALLTEKKTTSVQALADALKVHPKTIGRYLDALEAAGRVRRDGPAVIWTEE